MSVIAELRVPGEEFELGRILESAEPLDIELETMVPLRQRPVPFFLVHDEVSETFEARIARHPSVEGVQEVERHDGEVLYALEWDYSRDHLFGAMESVGAQLVAGRGGGDTWAFEIRFPSHDALSGFKEHCEDARVSITVDRIYNPTKPEDGPWFGLTAPQRETLVRAVEGGYYDIPRRMSTADLAEEFDVSDQAVTERLRRAIVGLTRSTLTVPEIEEQ
jgi:predicted DNA binding protein